MFRSTHSIATVLPLRTKRSATFLVPLLGSFLCSIAAHADAIYDNFSPGGAFDPQAWTAAAMSERTPFIDATRAAARFTVPVSATLSSITLPISVDRVSNTQNLLRVRLAVDNGGVPGATIEVLSVNQNIWPPIANPFTTTTTLNSATHPTLFSGASYWIVTEPTAMVFGGSLLYRWSLNNTGGPTVPYLQETEPDVPADPWNNPSQLTRVAFRVDGVVVDTAIYDNFSPGGAFDPQAWTAAAMSERTSFIDATRAAARFTASASATLSSITLPISVDRVSNTQNLLRVRLAVDNGGVPGATIEVLSVNQNIWPPIANPFTTKTTVHSAIHPTLVGGASYWIVTEPTAMVFGGSLLYRWSLNNPGSPTVPYLQETEPDVPADPWNNPSQLTRVAFRVTGVVSTDAAPGEQTEALGLACPNPFPRGGSLAFSLPVAGRVSLVIYDVAGRRVRTLANETLQAGLTRLSWDGKDGRGDPVPSGVYFVRMQANGSERIHKLTMLR